MQLWGIGRVFDNASILGDEKDFVFQQSNKTKFKRLKKAGKVSSGAVQTGFSDDEDLEEGARHGRNAEEELKRTLFGDGEGISLEYHNFSCPALVFFGEWGRS